MNITVKFVLDPQEAEQTPLPPEGHYVIATPGLAPLMFVACNNLQTEEVLNKTFNAPYLTYRNKTLFNFSVDPGFDRGAAYFIKLLESAGFDVTVDGEIPPGFES